MLPSYRLALQLALAVLLVTGGCRTYGGYGSEPETYKALQATVQSFEQELERAQADLRQLQQAASELDTLHTLAGAFQGLVDEHKSLLKKQHERIDRLSPEGDYRDLHTAYGATLTERRILHRKYQQTILDVQEVVGGVPEMSHVGRSSQRRYTVRPLGFPKQEGGKTLSMEQALRGM